MLSLAALAFIPMLFENRRSMANERALRASGAGDPITIESSPVSRARISIALDWLALLLVAVAVAIAATGGATFRVAGTRITARSADRAVVAVLAVVALRVALDRRTRPFARTGSAAHRVRDVLYDPNRDDEPALESGARWRRRAIALAALALFGAVLLLPQLRHMDAVPDLGDPLFSIW